LELPENPGKPAEGGRGEVASELRGPARCAAYAHSRPGSHPFGVNGGTAARA
jgi:hypothetical protein